MVYKEISSFAKPIEIDENKDELLQENITVAAKNKDELTYKETVLIKIDYLTIIWTKVKKGITLSSDEINYINTYGILKSSDFSSPEVIEEIRKKLAIELDILTNLIPVKIKQSNIENLTAYKKNVNKYIKYKSKYLNKINS